MERSANVVWEGSLEDGQGKISTASGTLEAAAYSFGTRFGTSQGTNPEELLGAAHSACFSMALSHELGKFQITPTRITTTASVKFAKRPEGWAITTIVLDTIVDAAGADRQEVEKAVTIAKENCPVSRALSVPIEVNFHMEGDAVENAQEQESA